MKFNKLFHKTAFERATEFKNLEIILLFMKNFKSQNDNFITQNGYNLELLKLPLNMTYITSDDYFEVYNAKYKETKEKYSINIHYVDFEDYSNKSQENIMKFIEKMHQLSHSSLIKYCLFGPNGIDQIKRPVIITEEIPKLTLRQLIGKQKFNHTKKLINIFGIASGMSYLHSNGIIHCNLNPKNIVEDHNLYPKIKNYWISNEFESLNEILKTIKISEFCSPEVILRNEITEKSDVYSFGLIVYETMTNKIPFEDLSKIDFLNKINEGINLEIDETIPTVYRELIKRCCCQNPDERPSFDDITKELITNKEFITESVNSSEYKKYINFITKSIDSNTSSKQLPKSKRHHRSKKKKDDDKQKSHKEDNEKEGQEGGKQEEEENEEESKNEEGEEEEEEEEEEEYNNEKQEGSNNEKQEESSNEKQEGSNNEKQEESNNEKQEGSNNEKQEESNNEKQEESNNEKQEEEENKRRIRDNSFIIDDKSIKILDINNYTKKRKMNENKKIYIIVEKQTNKDFVGKHYDEIPNGDKDSDIGKMFIREATNHSKCSFESILKFYGYSPTDFKVRRRPILVIDLCSKGSLKGIINQERHGSFPGWNDTKQLINIYGIAAAMKYLHMHNILHRDIKPDNVFVDDNLYPKLADFGLSNEYPAEFKRELEGTIRFLAPEIIDDYIYSPASDVYAFGILVYELVTKKIAFEGLYWSQVYIYVGRGERSDIPDQIDAGYRKLITDCWSQSPNDRPTFSEILERLQTDEFVTDQINKHEFEEYRKRINLNFK